MSTKKPSRVVPVIVGAVIVLVCVGALFWLVYGMMQTPVKQTRQVTQIVKIVRPPPPPPDQPPPPPPPDKVDEPLPKDTPEEKPAEEAPPSEQLGLDAEGSGDGDGFGLAARKGGRDLLATGGGVFAWYTSLVKDSVLDALSNDERVRHGTYSVMVRCWVGQDGRITDAKLATSTGSPQRDAAIEEIVRKLRLREGPPLELPQPVTLKISSHG
jgi:periplasmic protein TonB